MLMLSYVLVKVWYLSMRSNRSCIEQIEGLQKYQSIFLSVKKDNTMSVNGTLKLKKPVIKYCDDK